MSAEGVSIGAGAPVRLSPSHSGKAAVERERTVAAGLGFEVESDPRLCGLASLRDKAPSGCSYTFLGLTDFIKVHL